MRKCLLILLISVVQLYPLCVLAESFPSKPITIVVYTAPGGLIDTTSRKLASILEEHVVNVPVIIENKKGAGGLVALSYIKRKPADGHTLFALTSSVLAKAVYARKEKELSDLHYLRQLAVDYECLIAKKHLAISDIKESKENLVYAGPAIGGTDYTFTRQVWKDLGIERGRFIPYKSGAEAIASVLGGHADVYVGNPQDVQGRSELHALAVASPKRLKQFPHIPTFKESGFNINEATLWRGIAVRQDTPKERIVILNQLLKKATEHPNWISFLAQSGVVPSDKINTAFEQEVKDYLLEVKNVYAK